MLPLTSAEWLVLVAGITSIAWVNWYFFLAGRRSAAAVMVAASPSANAGTSHGPAEITIVVDGGYSPSQVRVKAGQPVRLTFDRRDTSGCSEEVVFPDFKIRKFLPTGQRTTIDITPPAAGRYEFMCGMSMLRGAVIAED